MARNERSIPVSPRKIWEVLADPRQYGYVVVGSKHIRGWDDDWPVKGAKFHHTVGVGPLSVNDSTWVVESDAPRQLELPYARGAIAPRSTNSPTRWPSQSAAARPWA